MHRKRPLVAVPLTAAVVLSACRSNPATDPKMVSEGMHTLYGATRVSAIRRFTSFHAAASEAGISRIYGGIHFPYGNVGGQALGNCVGGKVVERLNAARGR